METSQLLLRDYLPKSVCDNEPKAISATEMKNINHKSSLHRCMVAYVKRKIIFFKRSACVSLPKAHEQKGM